MRKVVTLIGGSVWMSVFCRDLAMASHNPDVELRLVARDRGRLAVIATDAAARLRRLQPGWRVRPMTEQEALNGPDIVIIMLRAGGLAARDIDESFPEQFGLGGDEGLGLGGMANALRTIPLMKALGARLRQSCPEAQVLNLVAPLGLTTRALNAEGVAAIGICELPILTHARLADCLSCALDYIGLNHLGWFWPRERGFDDQQIRSLADNGLAARATVEAFGAAPLKYHYRVFDPEAGRSIGIAAPVSRAAALGSATHMILRQMQQTPGGQNTGLFARDMPWLAHALTPITAGLLDDDPPWASFANLRNDGREPLLPAEQIVELRLSGETRISPPPPRVLETVTRFAASEAHVWRAHLAEDPIPALMDAIDALPLGRSPTTARAQALAVLAASRAVPV